MVHKPEPSLCDTCSNAYIVESGTVSMGTDNGSITLPQRYCSKLTISIHFGGKQKCDKYKEEK